MATKRVTHTFRKGDILEVKEYHDGRYGARGLPREKKRKPTPEQMAVVNDMNKAETARHRLLEYFGKGDYFLTLTYKVEERPPDMAQAKKDFTKLISGDVTITTTSTGRDWNTVSGTSPVPGGISTKR